MRKTAMLFAVFLVVVAGLAATGVITEANKEPAPPAASVHASSNTSGPAAH